MIHVIASKLVATWVGKVLIGGAALLTSVRYAGGFYAYLETEKLERPTYEVIARLADGVEIRRYEPYIIAETEVDASGFEEAGKAGFFPCAEYIFGKNKKRRGGESEKMAMTAPVRLDGGNNKRTKVSFVIGSNYTLKTVPKPLENKVKLRQVPAHTLAVKSFSGPPPKDKRVLKEREKLGTILAEAGIAVKNDGATLVYGYHDPFITPNILRRNEVAVLVDGRV
ncbi:SOUL heme-binding domain containing protein [Nitzschia inconspicua]|uniref:SOUL heme-binding domain containing protein n=1 Tax=Nitzschia inconspicua TaxID=303405 RepID=A0A9K3LZJ3_9STRA|nr:SOUL heme-binding domain containing protein [Nitzschia inconspicua]